MVSIKEATKIYQYFRPLDNLDLETIKSEEFRELVEFYLQKVSSKYTGVVIVFYGKALIQLQYGENLGKILIKNALIQRGLEQRFNDVYDSN